MGCSLPLTMRSSWPKKRDTENQVILPDGREPRAAVTIQLTSSYI